MIPVFCFSDKEAASSAPLVDVSWQWCGPVSAESSPAFINSLEARSGPVWLFQCGWLPAASQQGQCPGDMIDRWCWWSKLWIQDYLVGRKDQFLPHLSLPAKRSWHSVLEGSSLLACLSRRKMKMLVASIKNALAVFAGMDWVRAQCSCLEFFWNPYCRPA